MTTPASNSSDSGSVTIVHDRAAIDAAVKLISDAVARHEYPESSRFAVRLAIEEAISNAFRHGHKEAAAGAPVRVEYAVDPDQVVMTVEDQGPGFDPEAVPDPTLDENLEVPSGRGLMLIRAYMSSVTFNEAGNRITMVYRRPRLKP